MRSFPILFLMIPLLISCNQNNDSFIIPLPDVEVPIDITPDRQEESKIILVNSDRQLKEISEQFADNKFNRALYYFTADW